jgi:hypothetical protein
MQSRVYAYLIISPPGHRNLTSYYRPPAPGEYIPQEKIEAYITVEIPVLIVPGISLVVGEVTGKVDKVTYNQKEDTQYISLKYKGWLGEVTVDSVIQLLLHYQWTITDRKKI